jgi:hypothetical protein
VSCSLTFPLRALRVLRGSDALTELRVGVGNRSWKSLVEIAREIRFDSRGQNQ